MKVIVQRQTSPRVWLLRTAALLFSATSAFGFLAYFAMRLSVVDLLDKPGREAGVPFAAYYLTASLFCLIGSIVATALALPFYAGESHLSRLIGRLVPASILSMILTVLVGVVEFLIIGTFSSPAIQ